MSAITDTNFSFPGQTGVYHGKVRDVYSIGESLLVMVASDRISAFDVVLPRAVPNKGQVLNQVAVHFLQATTREVPNWLLSSPDPNVSIGKRCIPFKVEMVIRGYLAGHAWRVYESGERKICGVNLPEGLKESDRLPQPIITPTMKASEGHDEDITREEIIRQGLVSAEDYSVLENYTQKLFAIGSHMAAERGLILVDTKYEFGKCNGEILLMDEVHTPDSSRYFYADGYEERQKRGERQKQLSKEFVREWLISKGFMGQAGVAPPEMSDEWLAEISSRYIELFEKVTGNKFIPANDADTMTRIEKNVSAALQLIGS